MLYALLSRVDNSDYFFYCAVAIRVVEGLGGALLETPVYSLVVIEFSQNKDKYISYVELASGIGLTIGPFISMILYNYLHFAGTFLTYACLVALTSVYLYLSIPPDKSY